MVRVEGGGNTWGSAGDGLAQRRDLRRRREGQVWLGLVVGGGWGGGGGGGGEQRQARSRFLLGGLLGRALPLEGRWLGHVIPRAHFLWGSAGKSEREKSETKKTRVGKKKKKEKKKNKHTHL